MSYLEVDLDASTAEQLRGIIGELRDVIRKKEGKPASATVLETMHPDSRDFLGSGLTMIEYMATREMESIGRSFMRADRAEKRRRVALVVRLGAEIGRIGAVTRFPISSASRAVEAIIDGDWEGLKIDRSMFTFEGESADTIATYQPIYAPLVKIIDEALATTPAAPVIDKGQTTTESATRH